MVFSIQCLPNEIILLILMKLSDRKDVLSFTSTCHFFHNLIQDDLFWRDLIQRKFGIKYCDPNQTWWDLFISGDVDKMCCHINNHNSWSVLEKKRDLLWETFTADPNQLCCRNVQFDNYGLCMEPNCHFVGCGDVFFEPESYPGHLHAHHEACNHNIMLKLSPLNFMVIWCYSCNSPVGFWGFPKMDKPRSEKYICRQILKFMTELPTQDLIQRYQVIERRRLIEQRLSVFQHNHDYTYLVEKSWLMSWIDFMIGKTNDLPTPLDNLKLFHQDKRKLRHDLIIGVDYELVGSSIRTYIERVYGLENNSIIVSGDDFLGQPMYRSISQSLLLHRNFAINQR